MKTYTKPKSTIEPYLNFLRAYPQQAGVVLKAAPDKVVKTICNAAYNTQYNPEVKLTTKDRKLLAKHRRKITALTDSNKSLKQKRQILQKGGALPFLPVLLGSALATLGAHLFAR